ncbi:MAG: RluA family pseudouridine synthase [Bacteroidales bacterium]|jgi:23S rRNA pseudouridine1911/1915/1917 synthase|nr:RluA family pseudouridine synthase [Bacteroidales bacterium]
MSVAEILIENEENLQIENLEETELFEHFRFVIEKGQAITRIDKLLANRMASTSRTRIQNAAEAGNILVNDRSVKSNYKVKPGDIISIVLSFPKTDFEIIPQDIPLDIVYEDDDLVIVNKEAGMVVHPGFGNFEGTLVNALLYRFQQLPLFKDKPIDEIRPGLVHRIDKNTTGLLVIAKNEIAANKLAKQFFEHTCKRSYIALIWGNLPEDTGTIIGNIGRSLKNRKVMDIFPEGDYGKEAITHYKVIERLGYVNVIECRLETGRTHQIRVHMKSIGHPLFNDSEYGGDKIIKGTTFSKYKQFVENCFQIIPRQALHAKSLGFIHPTTNKEIFFESELPADMKLCIEKWQNYCGNENL